MSSGSSAVNHEPPGVSNFTFDVVLAEQRQVVLAGLQGPVAPELGAVLQLPRDRPVVVVPGDLLHLVLRHAG